MSTLVTSEQAYQLSNDFAIFNENDEQISRTVSKTTAVSDNVEGEASLADGQSAQSEIRRLNKLLNQRIAMQDAMKSEIQTLIEEKQTLELLYKPGSENMNWQEKYAELIEILRQGLKIDVLDGSDSDDENERDEKQVLHILRIIKDLQKPRIDTKLEEEHKRQLKEQKAKHAQEFKRLIGHIEIMEKTIIKLEKRCSKPEKLTRSNNMAIFSLNREDHDIECKRRSSTAQMLSFQIDSKMDKFKTFFGNFGNIEKRHLKEVRNVAFENIKLSQQVSESHGQFVLARTKNQKKSLIQEMNMMYGENENETGDIINCCELQTQSQGYASIRKSEVRKGHRKNAKSTYV